MRLRQVALASRRQDDLVKEFNQALDLKLAYEDPNVGRYGLRNAVLPAGTGFLEVVEPTTGTASVARFLARRGGDAGYMVILQVADAQAERDRVAAMGVRVVDDIDRPNYRCAHFHPADFGGVLASFDQQRTETDPMAPFGDWSPAGPDWRAARSDSVLDMTSVTIACADPTALAQRWATLIGRPLAAGHPHRLPLDQGAILFASAPAGAGTFISAVGLKVRDAARQTAQARAAGLDVNPHGILLGGVRFSLTDS